MKLSKCGNRNLPLYSQLEQIIKSKIIRSEFGLGDQIPTEKELAETYQVSVITARQAILNLVQQGFLTRRQGKGTYVSKEIKEVDSVPLQGTIKDLIEDRLLTSEVKVLDIATVRAPKRVATHLRTEGEGEMVRVRRTRSHNKVPISHVIIYLPLSIGGRIKREDFLRHPVLRILWDQLGIPLRSGEQTIEAIVADYDIASALSVDIGSPILYIETTIFSKERKPVEFIQSFFRPDRFKYSVKLGLENGLKW